MADEAGLSLEEYWEQIIEACYLREDDPVSKWKAVQKEIEEIKDWLDALQIERLHIKGRGCRSACENRRPSEMAERWWKKHT
jgi:aminopeptidase